MLHHVFRCSVIQLAPSLWGLAPQTAEFEDEVKGMAEGGSTPAPLRCANAMENAMQISVGHRFVKNIYPKNGVTQKCQKGGWRGDPLHPPGLGRRSTSTPRGLDHSGLGEGSTTCTRACRRRRVATLRGKFHLMHVAFAWFCHLALKSPPPDSQQFFGLKRMETSPRRDR